MNRRHFLTTMGCAMTAAALLPGCGNQTGKPPAASPPQAPPASAAAPAGGSGFAVNELIIAQGNDPDSLLERGLAALGGIGRVVKKGMIVTIKPNFSVPRRPDEACTTNPKLVAAVVKHCLAAGAKEVRVIDYPFTSAAIVLEKTGMKQAVTAAGGQISIINSQDRFQAIEVKGAKVLKRTDFAKDVLEANVFINMPILKHHNMAKLTMGLKNLRGIVWDRGFFHRTDLHQAIAELATVRKPDLVILDAIRGITDHGPVGPGPIREYNQLVLGADQVAVDAYGAQLFGMNPAELEYLQIAAGLGVGQLAWEKLTVKKV